jgi:hypothetical protein
MTERCWRGANADADRIAAWMCSAARALVPELGTRGHTVVHAIANALADDLSVNGQPPLDLTVETIAGGLAISVTDGRDCDARRTRPLPHVVEDIRPLTTSITMHRASGRAGCTLTAAIPLRRARTLRSRLMPRRRGRP